MVRRKTRFQKFCQISSTGSPQGSVQKEFQNRQCNRQVRQLPSQPKLTTIFLAKQLASAFAQTFSYHVGEHARATTAKIHRTAAASTSSAGGTHRNYGKYELVRLNEIGRFSLLKEAVLVSCLAFFSPLGGCRYVEDADH